MTTPEKATISQRTGLDQVMLQQAGAPLAELTDAALEAEIEHNRRAEYRLLTAAFICLLAVAALIIIRQVYFQ